MRRTTTAAHRRRAAAGACAILIALAIGIGHAASPAGAVPAARGGTGEAARAHPPAAKPPTCRGRNILDEMRKTAPALHARIMRQAAAMPHGEAMLWKIEGKGRPASWLFGTIHMTDARVHAFSKAFSQAFEAAGTVALEVVGLGELMRSGRFNSFTDLFLSPAGRSTLQRDLSRAELQRLARVMVSRFRMPPEAMTVMRPWFLSMMLSVSPCEQTREAMGLDRLDGRLEAMAKRAGKALVGLETAREQFATMASLPPDVELAWLRASLALYARIDDMTETMVQLYLARRIAAALPLSIALGEKAGLDARKMRAFQRILVDARNRRMAKRARPLLEKGGAFIAVGALHLPGREGLVALLRKAGWRLTPVE